MNANLVKWAHVVGALPRMNSYRQMLATRSMYFERLRIVNDALGPNWVFRLADVVGIDVIKENRPSWYDFYVEDIDRLHCPIDPGAPETDAHLGRHYADMDMAFYAGMGFDGYRLALQTPRHVNIREKMLVFDRRFVFEATPEQRNLLEGYEHGRQVPKDEYYSHYGDALSVLYERIDRESLSERELTHVAAGCLILLCGGHHGCRSHITNEIRYRVQMESVIIFMVAKDVISESRSLSDVQTRLRAVV